MVTRSPSLRPPLLLALFIVATAPFMGTLRDLLLDLFGRRFVVALAAGFAFVVAGLVVAAALRVREPRRSTWLLRLGGLALALVLLGVQVVGFGTGNLQVDAVERIHFLEYGALGLLFYRAFRRRFPRHKRIARWTLPIWLHVSITGVVVYWMLYRMQW